MQDLINEEEFITKKIDYNPWRRFGVFYGVGVAYVIGLYIVNSTFSPKNEVLLTILFLGIPFVLPFLMIFHKKAIAALPYKSILLAIIGLEAVIVICLLMIVFVRIQLDIVKEDITMGLLLAAVYLALGLLCFALMYPILRYKRKRLKQRL